MKWYGFGGVRNWNCVDLLVTKWKLDVFGGVGNWNLILMVMYKIGVVCFWCTKLMFYPFGNVGSWSCKVFVNKLKSYGFGNVCSFWWCTKLMSYPFGNVRNWSRMVSVVYEVKVVLLGNLRSCSHLVFVDVQSWLRILLVVFKIEVVWFW